MKHLSRLRRHFLLRQYAALPFSRSPDRDGLRILLVTSRTSGRWIIPKGWPIDGLQPHLSAAREAYEEAGVRGAALDESLGFYTYRKDSRASIHVDVFPLEVDRILKVWPERGQRKRRWFTLAEAAHAVSEPRLRTIIAHFDDSAIAFARPARSAGSGRG